MVVLIDVLCVICDMCLHIQIGESSRRQSMDHHFYFISYLRSVPVRCSQVYKGEQSR